MEDNVKRNRGLGRGLSALMSDIDTDTVSTVPTTSNAAEVYQPIEALKANPDQPRQTFDPAELEELAASIREKGVIQPLIVRPDPNQDGQYQIVAGERRWRAAQLAQLHELPVVVRKLDDQAVLEIAIIENIQRSDLNPLEEALGYRQLMDKFGHTQERLGESLGKSRSHIANCLRLLNLPPEVQEMLRTGMLSAGHARALITAEDPVALARQVVQRGLSVRETEKLGKAPKEPKPGVSGSKRVEKDADTLAIEGDLSATLKMRVTIDHAPNNDGGQMTIRYKDLDQLDDLCRALGGL